MEFLSPHVAMITSRQSPVSKVSFRQGRFSSRWISSVLPVNHAESASSNIGAISQAMTSVPSHKTVSQVSSEYGPAHLASE